MDRRRVLRAIAGVGAVALAGCAEQGDGGADTPTGASTTERDPTSSTTDGTTPDPTRSPTAEPTTAGATTTGARGPYGDWFRNTDNFDGPVDRTGREEVAVAVGAEGNGGGFAFAPAAIRVDPGTTVVWEWTGEGGQHNVFERNGEFESALVAEAGHTFRHTFRDPGTALYYCVPHKSLGMRGAVTVVEG